jgi:hypothetical protein
MTTREAFEAFISAPPFEMPTERFDDRCAWPGGYTELEVDLAWQAWQAAKATCPAWHDAPTVPGLWVHRQADRNQRKPLTYNQIWDNDDIMAANAEADLLMSELVTLVRAVEKAHGIT